MPALAASVMIATRLRPSWKARCSTMLTLSAPSPRSCSCMPAVVETSLRVRPESSATFDGPPSRSNKRSIKLAGNLAALSSWRKPFKTVASLGPLAIGSYNLSNILPTITSSPQMKPVRPSAESAPALLTLAELALLPTPLAAAGVAAAAAAAAAAAPFAAFAASAASFFVDCCCKKASDKACPVDHIETTTCSPRTSASSTICAAFSTLREMSNCLKKDCCAAQKYLI
mmetsp:Transcript_155220/g.497857  ORF Transcript_155220/g.497857 Transcript_155220/m.497857 type:complete len:229 (+) Transcript_155220:1764-2450(+)